MATYTGFYYSTYCVYIKYF